MNTTLNLAKLITVCDGITGRKKMQKVVHLLQASGFQQDFPYAFGYLHFGPYSHGVKEDLDMLTREQLVEEKPTTAGEHTTFRYVPADSLREGLDSVGVDRNPDWADLARQLNAFTPQRLEAASTIAFLSERGFSGESLVARFRELKPALVRDFDDALVLVERSKKHISDSRRGEKLKC